MSSNLPIIYNQIWDSKSYCKKIYKNHNTSSLKSLDRLIISSELFPKVLEIKDLYDEKKRRPKNNILNEIIKVSKQKRRLILIGQVFTIQNKVMLFFNDLRKKRIWIWLKKISDVNLALELLDDHFDKKLTILPHHKFLTLCFDLAKSVKYNSLNIETNIYHNPFPILKQNYELRTKKNNSNILSHLDNLESESIQIIREVVSQARNPVMLYSIGKDSTVMLHLAIKAFYPNPPPFKLLHIDTKWKFQEMYEFRNFVAQQNNLEILVYTNPEGLRINIDPIKHGATVHTDIMKTIALKQALDKYKFDMAFGGARRDEEKSRSKERIFSFRNKKHQWDPKNQRPELWKLYNGRINSSETIRIFPLSNWTEIDVWQYIYREKLDIVPLYFAAKRPVIKRNDLLLFLDDDRIELFDNEKILFKKIRFRTLGCYPLSGAFESEADSVEKIIFEIVDSKISERQGRTIDKDKTASMEIKKKEGYF